SRTCLCRTEYLINGSTWHTFHCVTKLLIHRLLTESPYRPQIRYLHPFFKRTTGRHDFAKDGLHISRQHRAWIAFRRATQYLRFTLGTENRGIGLCFDMTDLLCNTCTLIEQFENLNVDCIKLLAQRFELVIHG